MTYKHVMFRSAAREKVLRGATQLADAIRVTLGPKSKSVLIQKKWGPPLVCNDGVTIAKEFALKDAEENLGAQMLRQAAERTGDLVGDGTSGSTVLAHAMFADGVRNVVAGASAIDLEARPRPRGQGGDRRPEGDVATGIDSSREGPGGGSFRPQRSGHWRTGGRRDGEGRRRRGHHRRGVEDHRDRARGRGGNAVRSRLHLALFHHQPRTHGSGARGCSMCCCATARSPF